MSTKETGGAAFPEECNGQIFGGITKRDYFASKAMQIAHEDQPDCSFAELAEVAYALADAMLRERAK